MINFKYSRILVLLACLQVTAPVYSIWGWDVVKKYHTLDNLKWLEKVTFLPFVASEVGIKWFKERQEKRFIKSAAIVSPQVEFFVRSALKNQGLSEEQIKDIKITGIVYSNVPAFCFVAYRDADGSYLNVSEATIAALLSYREDVRENPDKQQFKFMHYEQLFERDAFIAATEATLAVFEVLISHEYAHIKNNDTSLVRSRLRLGSIVLFRCLGRFIAHSFMSADSIKLSWLRSCIGYALGTIFYKTTWYLDSRIREDRADREAIAVCHNTEGLRGLAGVFRSFHQQELALFCTTKPAERIFNESARYRVFIEWLARSESAHMPHLDRALFFEAAADKLEKEQKANEINEIS